MESRDFRLESESELESGFLMKSGIETGIKNFRNRASLASAILTEGLARLVLAKPSFGMTMTKILRPVFAQHSSTVFSERHV